MNNFLDIIYNVTGFSRVIDPLKMASSDSAELPLAEVLIVSRVLFAVVMIGFMGYFFDRIKQSIAIKSEEKSQDSNRR